MLRCVDCDKEVHDREPPCCNGSVYVVMPVYKRGQDMDRDSEKKGIEWFTARCEGCGQEWIMDRPTERHECGCSSPHFVKPNSGPLRVSPDTKWDKVSPELLQISMDEEIYYSYYKINEIIRRLIAQGLLK